MEKKETSQVKSNVISGISSTLGTAAGVVAGSVISSDVDAAKMPEAAVGEQDNVEVVSAEPSRTNSSHAQHNMQQTPQQEPVEVPEANISGPESRQETVSQEHQGPQNQEPTGENGETEAPGHEVEVLDYETVTNADGSQMDVATISVDGVPGAVVDVDQDHFVDFVAVDENRNDQIDNNEIIDVSGENIAMQQFQEATNTADDNLMAQNSDIDYINNADVSEYTA